MRRREGVESRIEAVLAFAVRLLATYGLEVDIAKPARNNWTEGQQKRFGCPNSHLQQ